MISTLGGFFNLNHFDQSSRANDVIVIRHKDGSLHSTPFNVRFGRARMWNNAGRVVQVEVNGKLTSAVMKIGKGGEAYWLQPTYGAFGQHINAEKASASSRGTRNTLVVNKNESRSCSNPAAAAAAEEEGAAAVSITRNKSTDGTRSGNEMSNNVGDSAKGSQADNLDSPSLSANAADRRQFSSDSKSSLEVPVGKSTSCDKNSFIESTGRKGKSGGKTNSSGRDTLLQVGNADGSVTPPPPSPSSGSPDPTTSLPLLHRGDNGHLMVEPRAIHSAEEMQEARLALRAVAAAEKSRRRLSKWLLREDAFFLHSAEEEGQLDTTAVAEAAHHSGDECHRHTITATDSQATTQVWDADALQEALDVADAETKQKQNNKTLAAVPPADAEVDGEAALSPSLATKAAAESNSVVAGAVTADESEVFVPDAAAAEVASSAGSRSGSTNSFKVEDTDDYFLDPIDADEYAAMYGEEELLKNVSFSSSVTSGVSVTDAAVAGSGSEISRTSPAKNTVAGADAAAVSASANPTSPSKEHVSHLEPCKPSGKADLQLKGGATATSTLVGKGANYDSAKDVMTEALDADSQVVQPPTVAASGAPYFTRTLIPVEADLWKLDLKDGCNQVRYLARKDKGEIVSISCNIFLWNWTDRLVVSDVDGTITKSDLLGHFYAMLGKGGDWTHPGICNLYSKIARNGYHMVYLTARSVSQINQTKSYLFTLQQDGVGLPLGPVLTVPQRFFTALTQEVSKQSHVFKIACLTSLRAAFPPHTKPFFAGFGNRYNDVISYDAVSIPTHKIFIIDPSSVLHVCLVKQTYRDLGHLVDVTFPPLKRAPVFTRAQWLSHHQEQLPHEHGSKRYGNVEDAERHAHAHDLLHRSSSASSSSVSSSCSGVSSSSFSYDPQEQGSATSDYSFDDASANSNRGVARPPPSTMVEPAATSAGGPLEIVQEKQQQQYHHHRHRRNGDNLCGEEDGQPTRHASVAFNLANSFCVAANGDLNNNTNGEGGGSGATTDTENSVSPANAALSQGSGVAGPTNAAVVVARAQPQLQVTHSSRGAGVASEKADLHSYLSTVMPESGSVDFSRFSGSPSPCMVAGTSSNAAAFVTAALATGQGSGGAAPATNAAGAASPASMSLAAAAGLEDNVKAAHLASSSNVSRASNVSAALQRGAANTSYTFTPSESTGLHCTTGSGPKYNYGQRGNRVAGTDGVYGAGMEDYEEEVPVDPDFSSFAYWRMDPSDLIAPPAKAAPRSDKAMGASQRDSKSDPRGSPPSTPADGGGPTLQRADANKTSSSSTATQPQQPTSSRSKTSLNTTTSNNTNSGADGSTNNLATTTSHPESAKGQGLTTGNITKDALKGMKEATVHSSCTVGERKTGADAAATAYAFPVTACAHTDLATGAGKDQSVMRDRVAPVNEEGKAVLPASANRKDSTGTSGDGTFSSNRADSRKPKLTVTSTDEVAAAQSTTTTKNGTVTRRGFFSSFGFGRGQSRQVVAPESPNAVKTRQAQEEVKKKALAHPDAWEYYRLQQQNSLTAATTAADVSSSKR